MDPTRSRAWDNNNVARIQNDLFIAPLHSTWYMTGLFASKSRIFYILLGAGISFIVIGSASALYTLTPISVSLNGTVEAGQADTLTPNMNAGNPVVLSVTGSNSSIEIVDPENEVITSVTNTSNFQYNFTAQKDGQYMISIENLGSSDLDIAGSAFTKGSQIALGGQLMLIVTGIIVLGLGLRARLR